MPVVRRILPTPPQQAADLPPETNEGQYIVSNSNRWSRIALSFQGLSGDTWCELSFKIGWHPDEASRNVHDFAVIGVDFLTDDGSSIDFAYVPGLTRTQIDPHSQSIPGPDYYARSGSLTDLGQVRCTFLVPSPAKQLLVTIRSWRNSHPFSIDHPTLAQLEQAGAVDETSDRQQSAPADPAGGISFSPRDLWRTLSTEPAWFSYAAVPGRRLVIRGQAVNMHPDQEGALVRILFRDAHGEPLPPPYPDTLLAPVVGAFINIPIHKQTRRFTLDLMPPPGAVAVELGFQARHDETPVELALPLEVSLEDDLLLENISGEDLPDALTFMSRLMERLDPSQALGATPRVIDTLIDREALTSPLTILEQLRRVQRGEKSQAASGGLSLGTFAAWSLPEQPLWTEDPFQSPAWRLEFQSLSWLLDVAKDPDLGGVPRALDLALSWSQSNSWGDPADVISAHPMSMAVRAEVLLHLLSLHLKAKRKAASEKLHPLFAEVIRHCFSLAQIIGQNVFSHSISQLYAACALLSLAQALPRVPLAPYWRSLALNHLRSGFDELTGPGGSSIEQSQHYRLEIISLGVILVALLENVQEAHDLRQHLSPRLKEGVRSTVALTDPAGMLPPFGDVLLGHHHASWLRRLFSGYGRFLLTDEAIATELSYPHGSRVFASSEAGKIVARHYEQKPGWGYLCTSFTQQRHEHGHFDCASFVYAAGGVRWITDPGGSHLYDVGPARQYLISSRAHNVAIPDGREQLAGDGWIRSQTTLEGAHIFEIGTNVYGPEYSHRRIFVCLDNLNAMAVFDHFTAGQRPISFEGYLHFEPDITAAIVSRKLVVGFRNRNRLRIIPRVVSGAFGGVSIENGRNDQPSSLQGFVSRRPGIMEPANVLRYSFSGQQTVCGGTVMAVTDQGLRRITDLLETSAVKELLG